MSQKYHLTKKDFFLLAVTGILILVTILACTLFWYWVNEPGIPVYMYHCIDENPREGDAELYVTPEAFEAHIQYLKSQGYTPIFANEIQNVSGYDKPVVITLDDGYEDNYTNAFPILKKLKVKATIFMVGSYINKPEYLKPEQIKEMSDSGFVSIQSHTWNHVNLAKLPVQEIDEELQKSKDAVESITGKPVEVISYPGGFYDQTVIKHVKKFFNLAYSVNSLNLGYDPCFEISRGGVYRSTALWSIEGSLKHQTRSRLKRVVQKFREQFDDFFDLKEDNFAT